MDARKRQRIFEAKKAGLLARLGDQGIARERAEAAFAVFEGEAAARALTGEDLAYWAAAEEAIRESARRHRPG